MTQNLWIKRVKPLLQPKFRLFCFPFAGGGASVFRTWSDHLPEEIEICAVQPPGRENRLKEAAFNHLDPLISNLLPAIAPYLDLPFAFFGHSVGALVCFELSHQLRLQKYSLPLQLFVSGRHAPQRQNPDPPIHHLPDAEFVEKLRYYDGTPEVVLQNAEMMALFLPLLRADLAVNETYGYATKPPLACPIFAFGGLEDCKVSIESLEAWREQTNGGFKMQMFPGGHFFWRRESHKLLDVMMHELSRLTRASTTQQIPEEFEENFGF